MIFDFFLLQTLHPNISPNFSAQPGLTGIKQAVNFDLSSFRSRQSHFMRLENANDMVPWCHGANGAMVLDSDL